MFSNFSEAIKIPEAINLVSALATSVAAFLIFWQIRSDQAWNRRQTSHGILNDFVSGTIEDSLEILKDKLGWDILHDDKSYGDVVNSFPKESAQRNIDELDRLLRRLLRRFEALCISMDHGMVHEKTCREYIFSLLITIFKSSAQFVEKERERRKEPKVFEFVQKYAEKWQRIDLSRRQLAIKYLKSLGILARGMRAAG